MEPDINLRLGWNETWINVAYAISNRATCPRLHAGAIIVKDNRIQGTGYNGAPAGMPHCTDVGCEIVHDHCVRTIHAEENAIIQAGIEGCRDAIMYITHRSCSICLKRIANVGIKKIVFDEWYRGDGGDVYERFCREADILVLKRTWSADLCRYIYPDLGAVRRHHGSAYSPEDG